MFGSGTQMTCQMTGSGCRASSTEKASSNQMLGLPRRYRSKPRATAATSTHQSQLDVPRRASQGFTAFGLLATEVRDVERLCWPVRLDVSLVCAMNVFTLPNKENVPVKAHVTIIGSIAAITVIWNTFLCPVCVRFLRGETRRHPQGAGSTTLQPGSPTAPVPTFSGKLPKY